ncbi:hypothetical protein MK137Hg11_000207400 [Dysgonomonas reticulitermitis]
MGHAPAEGSLLQLKENEVSDDSENATKGLVLPRVFLSDTGNLYPMFLSDPQKPGSGGNAAYQQDKATIPNPTEGVMVYNTGKNSSFPTAGYMYWSGTEWKLFSNVSSVSPKISQLYCDRAELSPGSYKKNVPYVGVLKIPYSGGNGSGDSGENTILVSSNKDASWGNEDVYFSSSPEQRSYM